MARCFVQCDLNHRQIESVLSVLRSHKCLTNLPKTARTLLQTTREPISLTTVNSSVYLHIGFKKAIINILQNVPSELIPNKLFNDISTDGASGDKSNRIKI